MARRPRRSSFGRLRRVRRFQISTVLPPVLSFVLAPAITPGTGSVGMTFTAFDGLVLNGSVVSRRWLLDGVQIGSGRTVVPLTPGRLVLEVTAAGLGLQLVVSSEAISIMAPGSVVGALPALPAPTITVTNAQEFRAAFTSTSPQVIAVPSMLDLGLTAGAGGFEDTSVVAGARHTIIPQDGYGAFESNPYGDNLRYARRFLRTATIKGFLRWPLGGEMYGIARTLDAFPAEPTQTTHQTWEQIGIPEFFWLDDVYGPESFRFIGCEWYLTPAVQMLVPGQSTRVVDRKSPATWRFAGPLDARGKRTYMRIVDATAGDPEAHDEIFAGHGDADWVRYNRLIKMPRGIRLTDWSGSRFQLEHCYFHHLSSGCSMLVTGTTDSLLDIGKCDFQRNYLDHLVITQRPGAACRLHLHNSIVFRVVSSGKDCFNPHSDFTQMYGINATNGVMYAIAHVRTWGNIVAVHHDDPGEYQGHFWQATADHYGAAADADKAKYKLVGAEIHESILIGANKFFTSDGQQDTLISNCIGFTQSRPLANRTQASVAQANFLRGLRALGDSEIPDSVSIVRNSVLDTVRSTGGYSATYVTENVVQLGLPSSSDYPNALAGMFADPNRALETVNDVFLAAKVLAAGRGPSAATLAEMMELGQPNVLAIGFATTVDCEINATVASPKAYLHGRLGASRTVVGVNGERYRVLNAQTGVEIMGLSADSRQVPCGSLIEISTTSPNAPVTTTTRAIDVDGQTVNWELTTKSLALAPLARFSAAQMEATASTGLAGYAATARSLALYFDFVASNIGTVQRLISPGSGTNINISISANSGISMLLRQGGNTVVNINMPTGTLASGQRYRAHIAINLDSGPTYDDCVIMYLNNVRVGKGTSAAVDPARAIVVGSDKWRAFAGASAAQPFLGDNGVMALWLNEPIDWSSAILRSRTSVEKFINGSEVTGKLPALLFRGNAATLNGASSANQGDGGSFDNVGSDVSQL